MNRKISRKKWFVFLAGCVAAATLAFALHTKASASDEIPKLAALMEWKPGTVVADIGAGDGSYAFAAVEQVGGTGKVFATEIDEDKLEGAASRSQTAGVAKRYCGRERGGGNEFARVVLRRDFFATRVSPSHKTAGI